MTIEQNGVTVDEALKLLGDRLHEREDRGEDVSAEGNALNVLGSEIGLLWRIEKHAITLLRRPDVRALLDADTLNDLHDLLDIVKPAPSAPRDNKLELVDSLDALHAKANQANWTATDFTSAPASPKAPAIDTVKLRPIQRRVLGSIDRADGEWIVAIHNAWPTIAAALRAHRLPHGPATFRSVELDAPVVIAEQKNVLFGAPGWATPIFGMVSGYGTIEEWTERTGSDQHYPGRRFEWAIYDQENDRYTTWDGPEPTLWIEVPELPSTGEIFTATEAANPRAQAQFLTAFGAFTVAELESRPGCHPDASPHIRENGKAFFVEYRGERLYPRFQFDQAGAPKPAIADVLSNLPAIDGWQTAFWFVAANPHLDGRAPVDVIDADPAALRAAAAALRDNETK